MKNHMLAALIQLQLLKGKECIPLATKTWMRLTRQIMRVTENKTECDEEMTIVSHLCQNSESNNEFSFSNMDGRQHIL